ncbi:hypothetical protein NF419_02550 [Streptococcus suis]|nr:hypothetical protein [Streptococcus suis]
MKKSIKDIIKMSTTKQRVLVGASVSALVLAIAGGLYIGQPTETKAVEATKVEKTTTSSSSTTTQSSSVDKEAELAKTAEEAVKKLEKNQVNENVKPAEDAVKALKAGDTKDKLQKRIDLVKLNMAHVAEQARLLADAERLVKQLEDNQVNDNVQPAQDAVDKVGNADNKTALQHRIDLVKQAIASRDAQAAQAAAQAQQASQATTGGDTGGGYVASAQDAGASYTPPTPAGGGATYVGGMPSADDIARMQQQVDDAEQRASTHGAYDY